MFKRFSIIVVTTISLGVALAIASVLTYNETIWENYQESFVAQEVEIFNYYTTDLEEDLNHVIEAQAHLSDTRSHIIDGDLSWFKNNATNIMTEMDLLNIDYTFVANDSLDFTYEVGGSYSQDLLDHPLVQDALQKKSSHLFYTYLNDTYALVAVSPITDSEEDNPTGLYMIASTFNEARIIDMAEHLGDALVSYNIYEASSLLESIPLSDNSHYANTYVDIEIPGMGHRLELAFDLSATKAYFNRQSANTINIIVIAAGSVAVALLILIRLMTKKINQIILGVKQISKGDYQSHLEMTANPYMPELNQLTQAVNKMSRDLDKHISLIDANYFEMVDVIITAVEINDKYTSRHNIEVGHYAKIIAEALGYEAIDDIILAAKLHDIGKISIPSHILNKPGRLTDEEYKRIQKHPVEGYKIIDGVDYFKNIKYGVKYHHEHWDGSGYPEGLAGNDIPLIAQIISIADVYDAVTSDRAYRKGLDHLQALELIVSESGKLFNPLIVDTFIAEEAAFNRYCQSIKKDR